MKKYFVFLLTLCFLEILSAQEHSVYGDTTLYGLANIANDDVLAEETEAAQFNFGLVQDLSACFSVGPLTTVNMDLLFTGSLLDYTSSESSGETLVAPVQMEINQLYMQLPLADTVMFYGGKRIKEMGSAQYFSLVNRINPRLFTNTRVSSQGAGLIELNYFPLYWLNIGGNLFFKDVDYTSPQWDELNILGQVDLQLYPFDLSLFSYVEGFENFPLGASASVQLGYFTVYGEYLYTYDGATKILSDATNPNCLEAFELRDGNNYQAVTSGVRYCSSDFTLGLEYSYNSDLLTVSEADDMQDYIENLATSVAKQGCIDSSYSQYSYLLHNAVFYGSYTPSFMTDFTLAGETVCSFPSSVDDFSRLWGYNAQLSASYALAQSVTVQLRFDWYSGGADSEYVLYKAEKGQGMLLVTISF